MSQPAEETPAAEYASNYAELKRAWEADGLALTRTWHCTHCDAVTVVDCVEIVLRAIEPPCTGCGKPLPWRQTFSA